MVMKVGCVGIHNEVRFQTSGCGVNFHKLFEYMVENVELQKKEKKKSVSDFDGVLKTKWVALDFPGKHYLLFPMLNTHYYNMFERNMLVLRPNACSEKFLSYFFMVHNKSCCFHATSLLVFFHNFKPPISISRNYRLAFSLLVLLLFN